MFYYDAHCHLQPFDCFEVAKKKNVKCFIVNGTHPNNWERVLRAADGFSEIIPCVGVHPWFSADLPLRWISLLNRLLEENPFLMIGEIGLDGTYPDLSHQIDVFKNCIILAQKYKRPIHVHAYKAWFNVAGVLECYPDTVCLLHRFTGTQSQAQRFLRFKHVYFSLMTPKAASFLPPEKILVESDSPDGNRQIENVIDTGNRCGCGWEKLDNNFLDFLNYLPPARKRILAETIK